MNKSVNGNIWLSGYSLVVRPQILKLMKNHRGTLENQNFFCWEGLTKGLEGGREPSKKPSYGFLISKKLKFQNLRADNQEVPISVYTYKVDNILVKCLKHVSHSKMNAIFGISTIKNPRVSIYRFSRNRQKICWWCKLH